jgi:nucleotide-binding universal stress UspA family protein
MKTLLVPIDFSDVTEDVIQNVIKSAILVDGRVILLHVMQYPPVVEQGCISREISKERELQKLEVLRERLEANSIPAKALIVDAESPAKAILAQAEAQRANALIIGSRGHANIYNLLIGSVTEKILRFATSPVLVVPRRAQDGMRATMSSGLKGKAVEGEVDSADASYRLRQEDRTPYKRILIPLDFSDATDVVVAVAATLVRQPESRIFLMHVKKFNALFQGATTMCGLPMVADSAESERECREILQKARARLRDDTDGAMMVLCEGPNVTQEILDHSELIGPDLMIIGSHGHGTVYNVVVGSVTGAILSSTRCPVLVVPALYKPIDYPVENLNAFR